MKWSDSGQLDRNELFLCVLLGALVVAGLRLAGVW
jgi:hypothetical protein